MRSPMLLRLGGREALMVPCLFPSAWLIPSISVLSGSSAVYRLSAVTSEVDERVKVSTPTASWTLALATRVLSFAGETSRILPFCTNCPGLT